MWAGRGIVADPFWFSASPRLPDGQWSFVVKAKLRKLACSKSAYFHRLEIGESERQLCDLAGSAYPEGRNLQKDLTCNRTA